MSNTLLYGRCSICPSCFCYFADDLNKYKCICGCMVNAHHPLPPANGIGISNNLANNNSVITSVVSHDTINFTVRVPKNKGKQKNNSQLNQADPFDHVGPVKSQTEALLKLAACISKNIDINEEDAAESMYKCLNEQDYASSVISQSIDEKIGDNISDSEKITDVKVLNGYKKLSEALKTNNLGAGTNVILQLYNDFGRELARFIVSKHNMAIIKHYFWDDEMDYYKPEMKHLQGQNVGALICSKTLLKLFSNRVSILIAEITPLLSECLSKTPAELNEIILKNVIAKVTEGFTKAKNRLFDKSKIGQSSQELTESILQLGKNCNSKKKCSGTSKEFVTRKLSEVINLVDDEEESVTAKFPTCIDVQKDSNAKKVIDKIEDDENKKLDKFVLDKLQEKHIGSLQLANDTTGTIRFFKMQDSEKLAFLKEKYFVEIDERKNNKKRKDDVSESNQNTKTKKSKSEDIWNCSICDQIWKSEDDTWFCCKNSTCSFKAHQACVIVPKTNEIVKAPTTLQLKNWFCLCCAENQKTKSKLNSLPVNSKRTTVDTVKNVLNAVTANE